MIRIGGIDEALMKDGAGSVVHYNDLINTDYWTIGLGDLIVGGTSVSVDGTKAAIVDTGTTAIMMSDGDYKRTIDMIKAQSPFGFTTLTQSPEVFYGWKNSCSQVYNSASLWFVFAGSDLKYEVTPESYMVDSGNVCVIMI
jgi:hypothetical protein